MDNRTWHDQRPSHKPIPLEVRVATEKYRIARKVYNEAVDYYMDNGEWDKEHVNDLAHIEDEAYKDMLEAKHNALNIPAGDRGTYEETSQVKMVYDTEIPFGVRVKRGE